MVFFDLLSKQSFAETWNQASGYLPDLCACLNTHIGMVRASVGRRLSGRTQVSAYFKKWLRKLAEILPPASWPCVRRPPPYYFYEILAVRDGFKPICSRVRSAAGPRAARESSSRAAGLLAAILPIRASTALRFLAEFFRILGDFSMGFAEFLPNSGLKNSQRKLCKGQVLLMPPSSTGRLIILVLSTEF